METHTLDKAKMQAFGEMVVNDTGSMLLGSLAYIGDQLNLFKTLTGKSPMTA